MLTCSDEVQSSTASFIASQQLQTEANIHPTEMPLNSFSSGENPYFLQQNTGTMAVDQARFPLVSDEEITEINETAASKNTARATKTWMAAWAEWCKARNINVNMQTYYPQALDDLLNKFYVEIRKKDGTDYEPDSLRVMQAAIDWYLRHKNYPVSTITGREFTKSQETLDAKAKQLRRQGKGKRPNKAHPYSETDQAIFWGAGKLGKHNGLALTNVNFKNLSETMGFRGRQDHYASVNSISAHPPPPGQPRGICSRCQFRGWGICNFIAAPGLGICVPWGDPRAFDTRVFASAMDEFIGEDEAFVEQRLVRQ